MVRRVWSVMKWMSEKDIARTSGDGDGNILSWLHLHMIILVWVLLALINGYPLTIGYVSHTVAFNICNVLYTVHSSTTSKPVTFLIVCYLLIQS